MAMTETWTALEPLGGPRMEAKATYVISRRRGTYPRQREGHRATAAPVNKIGIAGRLIST
jgi:hypothetical protein